MPNWCNNTLNVEGDLNALQDLKKRVLKVNEYDTVEFTMEGLMPTPPELLEQTSPAYFRGDENDTEGRLEFEKHIEQLEEKYGYRDWYDWFVFQDDSVKTILTRSHKAPQAARHPAK